LETDACACAGAACNGDSGYRRRHLYRPLDAEELVVDWQSVLVPEPEYSRLVMGPADAMEPKRRLRPRFVWSLAAARTAGVVGVEVETWATAAISRRAI